MPLSTHSTSGNELWTSAGRQIHSFAVKTESGDVASSPGVAAHVLRTHWQQVVRGRPCSAADQGELWRFVIPSGDDIECRVTREQVNALVAKTKCSALGPDTTPYNAWTKAGGSPLDDIVALYDAIAESYWPPPDANDAYLVFLDKAAAKGLPDAPRTPAQSRTPSLANTDTILIAAMLAVPPEGRAEEEGLGLDKMLYSRSQLCRDRVLKRAGVPLWWRRAVGALHVRCRHFLKIKGAAFGHLDAEAGLNQGCPLATCIGPQASIDTVADDIAHVIQDLGVHVEISLELFGTLEIGLRI